MTCAVIQGSYGAGVVAALHLERTQSQCRPTNIVLARTSGFFRRFEPPTCELRRHSGRSDAPAVRASSGEGVDVETAQVGVVEEILSGEWPENFSILNFEDLSAHLEPLIFKSEAQPSAFLADVMSRIMYTASPEHLLEEIDQYFANVSGLPVIDNELKCIGVISKKDRAKASNGLQSKVGEVMSSPAITLSADKTVLDAAILMLKNKIHRIPIVNEVGQVVGMVTRTDIFNALEGISG